MTNNGEEAVDCVHRAEKRCIDGEPMLVWEIEQSQHAGMEESLTGVPGSLTGQSERLRQILSVDGRLNLEETGPKRKDELSVPSSVRVQMPLKVQKSHLVEINQRILYTALNILVHAQVGLLLDELDGGGQCVDCFLSGFEDARAQKGSQSFLSRLSRGWLLQWWTSEA